MKTLCISTCPGATPCTCTSRDIGGTLANSDGDHANCQNWPKTGLFCLERRTLARNIYVGHTYQPHLQLTMCFLPMAMHTSNKYSYGLYSVQYNDSAWESVPFIVVSNEYCYPQSPDYTMCKVSTYGWN